MKKNISNKGFSLIEAVLYLAIVAILLTAVLSFHLVMGNTASKLSNNISVARNRRVALSAIDYLAKNSDGFLKDTNGGCSDLNSSPPVLALYFDDDTYLPGTCVVNGGGVRITLDNRRIKLNCYPNITNNGLHKACDTTTYPIGNSYYLTSPDVIVLNDNLTFATSTATTTTNYFTSLTTHLAVGMLSHEQVSLAATSTATSTTVMRNQNPDGLVAWYKFDDADDGMTAIDSIGNFDLVCDDAGSPTPVSGLLDGSSGSYDFNIADTDYCRLNNPDVFNFSNAFTIAAWVRMDFIGAGHQSIFYKSVYGDNQGYRLRIHYATGNVYLRICDSTACTDVLTAGAVISNDTLYHITSIYDLDNDIAKLYVYNDSDGSTSTTTASSIPILVNTNQTNYPRIGDAFDGKIDELKIYNRALTDEEVWALQSQGKY